MRCKNCHTGLMDTDAYCPGCHSSVERATAAAPGAIAKPSNLGLLLPMFGGAIGGAIYAGLVVADASTAPGGARAMAPTSHGAGGSSTVRWVFGLLLVLGGGLFLMLGGAQFWGTWEVAQRVPRAVLAADLGRKDFAATAPSWIAYTFAEAKRTDITVKRRRLGNGGEVQARCVLVRAGDKWLVATVAAGFEGNNLVGRIVPADTASSQALIERARKLDASPIAVLPYELNAVDGCACDQQVRYITAALLAGFGLAALALGLYLLCAGRRQTAAQPAIVNDWASRSVPQS